MNKDDYRKQAEELAKQARTLELTMSTYDAMEDCKRVGHDLRIFVTSSEFDKVHGFEINCIRCGACYLWEQVEGESLELYIPNNPEGFGDMAGKFLHEIEIPDEPEEETEPEPEEEVEKPLSQQESGGTYRVDVSGFVGGKNE